jgi:hypothetical protein
LSFELRNHAIINDSPNVILAPYIGL